LGLGIDEGIGRPYAHELPPAPGQLFGQDPVALAQTAHRGVFGAVTGHGDDHAVLVLGRVRHGQIDAVVVFVGDDAALEQTIGDIDHQLIVELTVGARLADA